MFSSEFNCNSVVSATVEQFLEWNELFSRKSLNLHCIYIHVRDKLLRKTRARVCVPTANFAWKNNKQNILWFLYSFQCLCRHQLCCTADVNINRMSVPSRKRKNRSICDSSVEKMIHSNSIVCKYVDNSLLSILFLVEMKSEQPPLLRVIIKNLAATNRENSLA